MTAFLRRTGSSSFCETRETLPSTLAENGAATFAALVLCKAASCETASPFSFSSSVCFAEASRRALQRSESSACCDARQLSSFCVSAA